MIETMTKPMKYIDKPICERIAQGTYKGIDYYVINLGKYPCAYVDITGTWMYEMGYAEYEIDCHGGLTYGEKTLATVEKEGWFIGWDYGHCGDYCSYARSPLSKKWTTEEIVEECKNVIDQIRARGEDI